MPKKMIALPRIHAELFQMKEGLEVLWPNLPNAPENAFVPYIPYPWNEALASQCLRDIAQDVSNGEEPLRASAYVQVLQEKKKDFSLNEDIEIRKFEAKGSEGPLPVSGEQTKIFLEKTQQILIFAFFQETLILDMLNIEAQVLHKGKLLQQSIQDSSETMQGIEDSEELDTLTKSGGASDVLDASSDSPKHSNIATLSSSALSFLDWRNIVSASIPFLGENPQILVTDTKMKQDLIDLAEKESAQEVSFKVSELFKNYTHVLDGKFAEVVLDFHFGD